MKTNVINEIVGLARAVCYCIPSRNLAVSIEPFDRQHGPSPHGWTARLVLYSDETHKTLLAVLAEETSEYNFQHEDWDWGPDKALECLRNKMRRKLHEIRVEE